MYYTGENMSIAVSVRLADEIVNELDELAIALERLRDKDDGIISSDEMREQLGL